MVFKLEEITELIGEYAAVVAHVTIAASTANALLREMTEEETQRCMNEIKAATESFVTEYRKKTARKGKTISKASTDMLRERLNKQIMLDCWVLMQKVAEEVKVQAIFTENQQADGS